MHVHHAVDTHPHAAPDLRARRWRALQWACTAAALAFSLAGTARAQAYPDSSKPVKIIVASGAASVVDLLARAQAKAMNDVAGLNVVVDNKPGAEMVIGTQAFLASPPDGYTLLVTSSSSQTLNPVMLPNLPYDPLKDMIPLTALSKSGLIMNLGISTQFKSARELVAAARANPGKYTCASASTTTRLACELLESTAGIKLLNVPYKTTAAAMTAVGGGEADMIFVDAGSAKAQWATGRVRGVAVTSTSRMSTLPTLPTLREEGITDYDLTAWYAAYVPARTPPEIVTAMRGILQKALKTKSFTETLANYSMDPLELTGDQVTDFNRREIEMWTRVVRAQKAKSGS